MICHFFRKKIKPKSKLRLLAGAEGKRGKNGHQPFFSMRPSKTRSIRSGETARETTMLTSRRRTEGESSFRTANFFTKKIKPKKILRLLAGAEGKRGKNSRLLFFLTRPMKIRRKPSECIDAMVFDYIFEPSENQR